MSVTAPLLYRKETRTQRRRRRYREIKGLCHVLCGGGPRYDKTDLLKARSPPKVVPVSALRSSSSEPVSAESRCCGFDVAGAGDAQKLSIADKSDTAITLSLDELLGFDSTVGSHGNQNMDMAYRTYDHSYSESTGFHVSDAEGASRDSLFLHLPNVLPSTRYTHASIQHAQYIAWHTRDLERAISTKIFDDEDLPISVEETTGVDNRTVGSLLEAVCSPLQESLAQASENMYSLRSQLDRISTKQSRDIEALHARLDHLSVGPANVFNLHDDSLDVDPPSTKYGVQESWGSSCDCSRCLQASLCVDLKPGPVSPRADREMRMKQLIDDMVNAAEKEPDECVSGYGTSSCHRRAMIQQMTNMMQNTLDAEAFVRHGGYRALALWLVRIPCDSRQNLQFRTPILQHLHRLPISLESLRQTPDPKFGIILKDIMQDSSEPELHRKVAAWFIREAIKMTEVIKESE